MPPESLELHAPLAARANRWDLALAHLGAAFCVVFALTRPEWRDMAHQWWDIDTYAHIVLVPPILAWRVWLRRL
jgi:hypothetical protein